MGPVDGSIILLIIAGAILVWLLAKYILQTYYEEKFNFICNIVELQNENPQLQIGKIYNEDQD